MPSFTLEEIKTLENLTECSEQNVRLGIFDSQIDLVHSLQDKCLAIYQEPDEEPPYLEITQYGRNVLKFYKAVKAGKVKKFKNECSSCKSPCDSI
jgi:hypothetical protein